MATKYTFSNQFNDVFERIIQINNHDYIFHFQRIQMSENTDGVFDYWNVKILDESGKVLVNKPIVYGYPLFRYSKPSTLRGNFVFVKNNTTGSQPSGSDFADNKAQLLYYADTELD